MLLERCASTLALGRLVERDRESLERQTHRSLLAGIIDHSWPAAEVLLRARALGVPLEGRTLVAVVARRRGDDDQAVLAAEQALRDLAETLAAAVREARVSALVGAIDDMSVGVLVAVGGRSRADEAVEALADGVRRASGEDEVVVAAGSEVSDVREARRSFLEASHVADAAGRLPGRPLHRLEDVRLRGLLHLLRDDARLQTFVEREIGPLLAYDSGHGTKLAELLADLPGPGPQQVGGSRRRPPVATRLLRAAAPDRAGPRRRPRRGRLVPVVACRARRTPGTPQVAERPGRQRGRRASRDRLTRSTHTSVGRRARYPCTPMADHSTGAGRHGIRVEGHQVGPHPRRDDAPGRLLERLVRHAGRARGEGDARGRAARGRSTSATPVTRDLPRDRDGEALERDVRGDRPVGAGRQPGAGSDEARERVLQRGALRPEPRQDQPDHARLQARPQWFDVRDDAEGREPRDVGWVDDVHVGEHRPAVARPVDARGRARRRRAQRGRRRHRSRGCAPGNRTASKAVTARASSAGSQTGSPQLCGWSAYGSSIAAVPASTTPSANSLTVRADTADDDEHRSRARDELADLVAPPLGLGAQCDVDAQRGRPLARATRYASRSSGWSAASCAHVTPAEASSAGRHDAGRLLGLPGLRDVPADEVHGGPLDEGPEGLAVGSTRDRAGGRFGAVAGDGGRRSASC